MRDYGTIRGAFWGDKKVQQLSHDALTVFTYLLTCPHGNALGCFKLPVPYIAHDLEPWLPKVEKVQAAIEELQGVGLIEYCHESEYVLILNFLKHNNIQNPNVGRHCVELLEEIAAGTDKGLIFWSLVAAIKKASQEKLDKAIKGSVTVSKWFKNSSETVARRSGKGIETPEPEPEPESESEPEPAGANCADVGGENEVLGEEESGEEEGDDDEWSFD